MCAGGCGANIMKARGAGGIECSNTSGSSASMRRCAAPMQAAAHADEPADESIDIWISLCVYLSCIYLHLHLYVYVYGYVYVYNHTCACIGSRVPGDRLQRVLTSQLIEAKKKQNELLRM